jgi:hypothetical protein
MRCVCVCVCVCDCRLLHKPRFRQLTADAVKITWINAELWRTLWCLQSLIFMSIASIYVNPHQIYPDDCTRVLLKHHFVSTLCHSDVFRHLKGPSLGSTVDTFQKRVLCYLPRDTLHTAQWVEFYTWWLTLLTLVLEFLNLHPEEGPLWVEECRSDIKY